MTDIAAATSADDEFSEGYAVCDVIREVDVPRGLLVVVGRREVIEDSITFSAFVEVHQLASTAPKMVARIMIVAAQPRTSL
jgi:hypothetical protein